MIREMEELQIFLLANPDEDHELTEPNLISYALIKLTKTGAFMPRISRIGRKDIFEDYEQ